MTSSLPAPAEVPTLPGGQADTSRRLHQRFRRDLLSGQWLGWLQKMMAEQFDPTRGRILGRPTLAKNMAKTTTKQLSVLYDRPPTVLNEEAKPDALKEFTDAIEEAGVWQMGRRLQQHVLLVNEGLRAVEVVERSGVKHLLFRHVNPDEVYAEAVAQAPDRMALVVEARWRTYASQDGTRKVGWTWDVHDIRDPKAPKFAVLEPHSVSDDADFWEGAIPITQTVLGVDEPILEGDAYTWRFEDGDPYIPKVLYHQERTGQLWDPWEGIEIVEGTLTVAVLTTFLLHCVKSASWPQRWVLNAILRGLSVEKSGDGDNTAVGFVPADPATIMQWVSDGEDGAPMFGQWQAGCDPERLEMAIRSWEAGLAAQFDVAPDDFMRSGSAESGYAITLKRGAVREAQRRFAPQFSRGDTELLRVCAELYNRNDVGQSKVPESGWRIVYCSLPMTQQEVDAEAVKIKVLAEAGVNMSEIAKVMQLHQCSRADALALLKQWKQDAILVSELDAEIQIERREGTNRRD